MNGTITGELRELLRQGLHSAITTLPPIAKVEVDEAPVLEACDAIDAVHANLERENASLKAELDRVLGEQDRDGWVELPKDAEGEYVHIGDVVDSLHYEDGTVTGIQYDKTANGNITTMVSVLPHGWDVATWRDPECYRHYQPDTWERIIRDAIGEGMARQRNNDGSECCERANPMNNDALVARCRALAGDAS